MIIQKNSNVCFLQYILCLVVLLVGCSGHNLKKAIRNNDLNGVKSAIASGADVNWWGGLFQAAKECKLEIAWFLIEKGADVNARYDVDGDTVLMAAAKSQCPPSISRFELMKLLIDRGADLNAKNKKSYSPILYAARIGDSDLMKFLHNNGAIYPEPPVLLLGSGGWLISVQNEGKLILHRLSGTPVGGIDQSLSIIKPGLRTLQVHYSEPRKTQILPYGAVKHTDFVGDTKVILEAKKCGIYVLRWEVHGLGWKAWIDSYEPMN
jgi:ankyrin repeat protein